MIDITGVDLIKFVKKVYELSKPLGFGIMHYTNEIFTDEEAKLYIRNGEVFMDYVRGRSCKMKARKDKDGKLLIEDKWYDHTDVQLTELLNHVGIQHISDPIKNKHNPSCECEDCLEERRLCESE